MVLTSLNKVGVGGKGAAGLHVRVACLRGALASGGCHGEGGVMTMIILVRNGCTQGCTRHAYVERGDMQVIEGQHLSQRGNAKPVNKQTCN